MKSLTVNKAILSCIFIAAMAMAFVVAGCESDDTGGGPYFTEFSFPGQKSKANINKGKRTIEVEAADTTDVRTLVVVYKTSPPGTKVGVGKKPQVSGETPQDFTGPVEYELTSEDGASSATWKVTVKSKSGGNNNWRPMKSGTVHYEYTVTTPPENGKTYKRIEKRYISWDDHGNKQRVAAHSWHEQDDEPFQTWTAHVFDRATGILSSGYLCEPCDKKEEWTDAGGNGNKDGSILAAANWTVSLDMDNDALAQFMQIGGRKTVVTVAGVTCNKYSFPDGTFMTVWGGTIVMESNYTTQADRPVSATTTPVTGIISKSVKAGW